MNGDGFKCIECGEADVDEEDAICDDCALAYEDEEDQEDDE